MVHNPAMTWRLATLAAYSLSLGVLLAGCGPVPVAEPPVAELTKPSKRLLPRPAMTHTIATGYEAIADKFIRSAAVADIALHGLEGLGSVDPALVALRDDDNVMIRRGDTVVAQFRVPQAHDVGAWARLSVDAVSATRSVSDAAAAADSEAIYEALFDSALSQLDLHSRYAGAKQARARRAKREGFGGIGIRFRRIGPQVRISDVVAGTPAATAGLQKGDTLLTINGRSIARLDVGQIRDRLRGPINSRLHMRVRQSGKRSAEAFDLVRQRIIPPSVFPQKSVDGIVTLRITTFNHDTAASLSRKIEAQKTRLGAGFKGVILDLRGNPGGLLRQAVEVADLFLETGAIVQTHGRHPESHQSYDAVAGDIADGRPMAVLIDAKSASAAEIVAAALQDHGRAAVIGTTSYGKGTVQTVIRLPNDGEMTLTWSRFIAPSGYALHHLGVRPVFCTSNAGLKNDAAREDLWRHATRQRADFAVWRSTGLDAERERASLRGHCRPQRRRDNSDLALARRILGDDPLYGLATARPGPDGVADSAGIDNRP